jgi:hypothetical protein
METSKTTSKFFKLNENPNRYSAWLNDKGRCCQRKIATIDQKRRDSLFKSNARAQIRIEEAEEIINLYFCNGWHRPKGKHPIPCLDRNKILQILFTNTPEPANGDAAAP